MKKIILLLILPIILFAEVYNVPVGSQGNKVVLKIFNNTGEDINNLVVAPKNDFDCIEILENTSISPVETNSVQSVEFIFNVAENAIVDSVYDLHFDILSDNGLKSNKTIQIKIIAPEKFELFDNYPNPFNPITNIKYMLPEESKVNLSIYNLRGQLVESLVQKKQVAGIFTTNWNATNFASGVYFYRIKVEDSNGMNVLSKKMILVK